LSLIGPKSKFSWAKDYFNQPSAANLPNLVTLKLSKADPGKLHFWSDLAQILDLGPKHAQDSVGFTPLS
jgi:hypothetical protein